MGDKPTDIGYGRGEEMKNVLNTFSGRLFRGMLFRHGMNSVSRDYEDSPQGYTNSQICISFTVEGGASITLICDRICLEEERYNLCAGDYYNEHIVVLDADGEGIVYFVNDDTGQVVRRVCTGLRQNASDNNMCKIMLGRSMEEHVVDSKEIDGLADFVESHSNGQAGFSGRRAK